MELEKIVQQQSDQIAQLTDLVSRFFGKDGLATLPEKCYNGSIQNSKGGTTKGRIATDFNQPNEEELKFMQTQKNVRKRKDGRFEWQKMIGGVWHREIDKCYKTLKRKIAEHERELKIILRDFRYRKPKQRHILLDLCRDYIEVNKSNKSSASAFTGLLKNHLHTLTKPIDEYTKVEIKKYLDDLSGNKLLCYQLLKNVFAEATEEGKIDRNIIATLKCPDIKRGKGRWFTLEEQKLIQQKKHLSGMADEIDFYLMTGCRLNEAPNCVPDFDRCTIYVHRSKINGTSGTVKISQEYCNILKEKWHTMFKQKSLSIKFTKFLTDIGIKSEDTSLHSLRHTFCTNIYYLGAPSKLRQYYMGHKDSRMTNDRYTSYDPTITRQDILAIYGELYPNFIETENTKTLPLAS